MEVVYIFKVIMTCETDSYLHVFSIKTIGRESLLETLLIVDYYVASVTK